jgi:hypothetical protein
MDEYDAHPSEGILPESGCTAESEGEAIVYGLGIQESNSLAKEKGRTLDPWNGR